MRPTVQGVILLILTLLVRPLWAQTKPGRRHEISQAVESFTAAWNRSDAPGISQDFLADGSLVIPEGLLLQSRDGIESFYRGAFVRGYAGSHAAATIRRVVHLRGDIAMIDGEWSIVGARDTAGNRRSDERGIFFAVVVQRNGKWLIAALREQTSAAKLQVPVPEK